MYADLSLPLISLNFTLINTSLTGIGVVSLIDDFSMVQFLQLESQNEDSVQATLSYIDDCLGWSEVQEPQIKDVDQDWEEPAED